MTAIGGFWDFRTEDAHRSCTSILAALQRYGPAPAHVESAAGLALGKRLHPALDNGSGDDRPLIGSSGSLLAADVRLDDRAGVLERLGLGAAVAADFTDSALLLSLFERLGPEAVDAVYGDFALAWYQPAERRLTLARDYLGQRPLFYVVQRDFAAFASMPSGLQALGAGLNRGADLATIARHVAVGAQAGAASYAAGVCRVQPGHVVTIEADGRVHSRRYWEPQRRTLVFPAFSDYVDAFQEALDRATAARLRDGGPVVATHLSGGWDSSAVTATAARLLGERGGRVAAFTAIPRHRTIAPPGRFLDETSLAAATASLHPNIEHHLVSTPDASPLSFFERNDSLFQRPLFNPCNHVWLAQIRSQAADAGATVLLTGELGNWNISASPTSLLGDLVRENRWRSWAREAHSLVRNRQARWRGVLARSFGSGLPRGATRLLTYLSSGATTPAEMLLRPDILASLTQEDETSGRARHPWPNDFHKERLSALTEVDYGEYRKGVLAGWGIDKRDVTADRKLMEFCMALPLDMLLKKGERRPLARAALADRLPQAVTEERRKGYQAADWHVALTRDVPAIRGLAERIADDANGASIIHIDALYQLIREWPAGGWERPNVIIRYRSALLHALAAGHFLLSAKA